MINGIIYINSRSVSRSQYNLLVQFSCLLICLYSLYVWYNVHKWLFMEYHGTLLIFFFLSSSSFFYNSLHTSIYFDMYLVHTYKLGLHGATVGWQILPPRNLNYKAQLDFSWKHLMLFTEFPERLHHGSRFF